MKSVNISLANQSLLVAQATAWLHHFAHCVRHRDFEGGMHLFSPTVYAFGTRAEIVKHLEDLVANQWRPIWLNTTDFRFLDDSIHCITSPDQSLICTLALWESYGLSEEGQAFLRRGRSTITLMAHAAAPHGYWAVHSHFSKVPSTDL